MRGNVASGPLPLLVIFSTLVGLGWARDVTAQAATRSEVIVDYVAGEDVYLGIGASQGVEVGDTLALYRSQEPDAAPFLRVVVTGASRTRAVVVVLDGASLPARGDVVYVVPSEAGGNVAVAGVPEDRGPDRPSEPRTLAPSGGVPESPPGPRWSGRVSVEVAARENTVSWTGNLAGETRRRFATPTGRLTLRGTDFPGGWRFDANLRAAYRYTDGPAAVTPATSIRAYRLSVSNRIERLGMDVRLGRFTNPFESYSGYWDGLLLRVGSERGGGVGVVAGLEPDRYDEAPSRETKKISGFANYSAGQGSKRYATDVSFHVIRGESGLLTDRTFAGWSQSATLGAVRIDQRLQVDRDEDTGTWSLTRLRLRSSVGFGPGRFEVGVGRSKPSYLRRAEGLTAPSRDQANVGLTVNRGGMRASIRAGVTERDGADRGWTFSGSASGMLGRVGLSASASRWNRSEMSTLSLSPALSLRIGGSRTRFRYRYYRFDGFASSTSHTAEIGTSVNFQRGLQFSLMAQQQWGQTYEGTRILTGLSKSF